MLQLFRPTTTKLQSLLWHSHEKNLIFKLCAMIKAHTVLLKVLNNGRTTKEKMNKYKL